jgi:hypothetical protein
MLFFRFGAPLMIFAACSPAPTPEGPTPEPSSATTAPAAAATDIASATSSSAPMPSGTSQPSAPARYAGSLKSAQVIAGIDNLVSHVLRELKVAGTKEFADGIAVLMALGPIGVRVHEEFWLGALAADMNVDTEDLDAFFDDESAFEEGPMRTALNKVKKTFADYKAVTKELESGIPEAGKASCAAARKKHAELAPKMPAEGTKFTKAVLDVVFPFIVADQALKRCEKAGIE